MRPELVKGQRKKKNIVDLETESSESEVSDMEASEHTSEGWFINVF